MRFGAPSWGVFEHFETEALGDGGVLTALVKKARSHNLFMLLGQSPISLAKV